ncbi:MAG: hypothetical protein ACW980_25405 [Promethearchaeota archaeon]|jgi:hypothetical protein
MGNVNKNNRFKVKMPDDAEIIKQYGSWDFYFSKSKNTLFVEVTEYHPHPLRLTENQFIELIGIIDSAMASAKKETGGETVPNSIASGIEDKRNIEIYINKQKLN